VKQGDPALANLDKLKVSPITGVHFWFDRQVMKEPFITLIDTTTAVDFQQNCSLRRFERNSKDHAGRAVPATGDQRVIRFVAEIAAGHY